MIPLPQVSLDNFTCEKDNINLSIINNIRTYTGFNFKPKFFLFGTSSTLCSMLHKDKTIAAFLYKKYNIQVANYGHNDETFINLYIKIKQLTIPGNAVLFINSAMTLYVSQTVPKSFTHIFNNYTNDDVSFFIKKKEDTIKYKLDKERYRNLFKFLMKDLCSSYRVIPYFIPNTEDGRKGISFGNDLELEPLLFLDEEHHFNEKGSKKCADFLYSLYEYNKVLDANSIKDVDEEKAKYDFIKVLNIQSARCNFLYEIDDNIKRKKIEYKKYLKDVSKDTGSKITGFVVLACNPVTKGHLYLIQKALEIVDVLYIQLNNSDKLYFPHHIRKAMLEACLPNRCILLKEDGGLIDNTIKFGNYFYKTTLNQITNIEETIDFLDLAKSRYEIYLHTLNIDWYFYGIETNDCITTKLVQTCHSYFLSKGISVKPIERIKNISATECRLLYNKKDWEALQELMDINAITVLKKYSQCLDF